MMCSNLKNYYSNKLKRFCLIKQVKRLRKFSWMTVALLIVIILLLHLQHKKKSLSYEKNPTNYKMPLKDSNVEYISEFLIVRYTSDAEYWKLELSNSGSRNIICDKFEIYFTHIVYVDSCCSSVVCMTRVNGFFFKITPSKKCSVGSIFLKKYSSLTIDCLISISNKFSIFPNWYVVGRDLSFLVIKSTIFDDPVKLISLDPSLKAEARFFQNSVINCDNEPQVTKNLKENILPTPSLIRDVSKLRVVQSVLVDKSWTICVTNEDFTEANFLAKYLKLKLGHCNKTSEKSQKTIVIKLGDIENDSNGFFQFEKNDSRLLEGYVIILNPDMSIVLKGTTSTGVFYAVNTLISMILDGPIAFYDVSVTKIFDFPKYKYRGLLLDVSRHFLGIRYIKKVITLMSRYKMNVLHLHLTDDEAWRLEIPDIPELTEIGSKPVFAPKVDRVNFLYPFLRNEPEFYNTSKRLNKKFRLPIDDFGENENLQKVSHQYYRVHDYRNILRHAVLHHVTILPEIDLPGHAHAAIVSMRARKQRQEYNFKRGGYEEIQLKLRDSNITGHKRVELTQILLKAQKNFNLEAEDEIFEGHSINYVEDTVINMCLGSSLEFISTVVQTLVDLHKHIQPLTMIHLGGDEVPHGSFNLRSCQDTMGNKDMKQMNAHALEHIVEIGRKHNLEVVLWGSDVMRSMSSEYLPKAVNFWFHKRAENDRDANMKDLTRLDNLKIILSDAGYFYLDHPHEDSNEENGMRWSTAYTDERNILMYEESKIFRNPLVNDKILGVQASLWGEMISSDESADYMLYPRLLAFAQYAWSVAPFMERRNTCEVWMNFVEVMMKKEFKVLDSLNVRYRVPPPGAILSKTKGFLYNVKYPGMEVEVSFDEGHSWVSAKGLKTSDITKRILLSTLSVDRSRRSRVVALDP